MKPSEQIKSEYKQVLLKAKLSSAILIISILPSFFINITDKTSFLGFSETNWDIVAICGGVTYLVLVKLLWKCPNCGNFPGGGWHRLNCKSCGTSL